jgi:hypothetical protein
MRGMKLHNKELKTIKNGENWLEILSVDRFDKNQIVLHFVIKNLLSYILVYWVEELKGRLDF